MCLVLYPPANFGILHKNFGILHKNFGISSIFSIPKISEFPELLPKISGIYINAPTEHEAKALYQQTQP
jgi:hypothetical protein